MACSTVSKVTYPNLGGRISISRGVPRDRSLPFAQPSSISRNGGGSNSSELGELPLQIGVGDIKKEVSNIESRVWLKIARRSLRRSLPAIPEAASVVVTKVSHITAVEGSGPEGTAGSCSSFVSSVDDIFTRPLGAAGQVLRCVTGIRRPGLSSRVDRGGNGRLLTLCRLGGCLVTGKPSEYRR